MSVYDTVILSEDVELSNFPYDIIYRLDGEYRHWQTKDLNPSLDFYTISKSKNLFQKYDDHNLVALFRRHPPISEWTIENKGLIEDYTNIDIVDDADHWRLVRCTGNVNITTYAENGESYEYRLKFNNGILEETQLIDVSVYNTEIHDYLLNQNFDMSENPPSVKGTDYNVLEIQEMVDNKEFEKVSEIPYNKVKLALRYLKLEQLN